MLTQWPTEILTLLFLIYYIYIYIIIIIINLLHQLFEHFQTLLTCSSTKEDLLELFKAGILKMKTKMFIVLIEPLQEK